MNSFLSQIKNSSSSSKSLSFLLINIFQIQISISMFLGTSLNIFNSIQFIYVKNLENLPQLTICSLLVHILVLVAIIGQIVFLPRSYTKSVHLTKLTISFINCYKNLIFIPAMYLVFQTIDRYSSSWTIPLSIVNFMIGMFLCYIQEVSGRTYRFRVKNWHQKIVSTFTDTILLAFVVAINCLQSPKYGAIILIIKNIYRLSRLYSNYQEPTIQRVSIFHSLYQIFVSLVIIMTEFLSLSINDNLFHFLYTMVFAAFVTKVVSNSLSLSIYRRMLFSLNHSESLDIVQTQQQLLSIHTNKIRSMSMVLLEKENYDQNNYKHQRLQKQNEFDKWWQFYNKEVISHRLSCENIKCECKQKDCEKDQLYLIEIIRKIKELTMTFTKDLKLTIMNIYQYIELSKRPLKAYYELMKLKAQTKTSEFQVQLNQLTIETRECFDKLIIQFKIKNQKLELLKVIEFQQLLLQCEQQLKLIVSQTIRFYSIFNQNNLKLSKIKQESNLLTEIKSQFESKLSTILQHYSSNIKLTVLIHFFYTFIEVYQNKQSQLKKITQANLLKKRFLDKNQLNVFSPEYGTFLIDLVEDRGRIKNVTKNMCALFGYPKQDMTSMNINQFMPRLFGYHHGKFLNNFIEKGKIRLLSYSGRDIFGRNKKKFIFPLKISLKVEYFQNNFFGSTGLIKQVQSSSQYILVDRNGKIEEITEHLYKRIFSGPFQQQPHKVNRLQINKILPSYNFFFEQRNHDHTKYDRLCEGIILFSADPVYLLQKFKFVRQQSKHSKTLSNNPKSQTTTYTPSVSNTMSKTETQAVSNPNKKQDHKALLADNLKNFITEIDLSVVEGYRVQYKVSPVVTAEFEADLIQFVSVKSFMSEQAFCQTLIDQLQLIMQIFDFNQSDHSLVFTHLHDLRSQLASKSNSSLHSKTFNSSNHSNNESVNNLIAIDAPRNAKNSSTKLKSFEDIKSVSFEEQQNNKFEQQNDHLIDKVSTHRSSVDNLQSESKKQVLINTFSNDNLAVDSRYSIIAQIVIVILFLLLISVSVLGVMYTNLLDREWTSLQFIQHTRQLIEYRTSLQQIALFTELNHSNSNSFAFITDRTKLLTNAIKKSLDSIYMSVVEQNAYNQFFTQKFTLENALTAQTQQISLFTLLKQLLWRFMYQSERNTEFFRATYESFTIELRQLQLKIVQFLYYKENFLRLLLLILNVMYLVLIVLGGIGIIPVYLYFRNQEKALTQLLQYISFRELRKSLQKLNTILYHLNKIDTIKNISHMKNQFNLRLSGIIKDSQLAIKQAGNYGCPRIVTEQHNDNEAKGILTTGKILFIAFILIVFLSNLSVFMLIMETSISSEFASTIELNQLSYELQNKPAYLLNTYLKNVNNELSNQDRVEFSSELYTKIEKDYFAAISLVSTPDSSKSKIYENLQSLMNQPLCSLVECSATSHEYFNSTTFYYLVYQFRNKFDYLSANTSGTSAMTSLKIPSWLQENNIPSLLESIETILAISQHLNPSIYFTYQSHLKSLTETVLIVNIVLILINTLVLILVKYWAFSYLSLTIKESLSIFKHFDLDTLSENTYLTSYFTNKLKEAK